MSSNEDNPRRDPTRPDENPFIAFRRFADAHVSSLLNMVLTIPATMADFTSQRQRAHYQCLFGQADPVTCRRLLHLEDEADDVIAELQDMEVGVNAQSLEEQRQWVDKRKELDRLGRETDALRREILGDSYHAFSRKSRQADIENELVERVANKKGQQWAWDWDWGFPKPFEDNDERSGKANGVSVRNTDRHLSPEMRRAEDVDFDAFARRVREECEHIFNPVKSGGRELFGPDAYSPQALESDHRLQKAGVLWRDAFEDLVRTQVGEPLIPKSQLGQSNHMSYQQWIRRFWDPRFAPSQYEHRRGLYPKRVPWEGEQQSSEEPEYEYGHDHEDQHDDPPTSRASQAKFQKDIPSTELEAYERLLGSTSLPAEATSEPRPSVFSTLTTTERTMLPDGTVTTRTVLKKRFADGREETSESVHTQHAEDMPRSPFPQQDPAGSQLSNGRVDSNKKQGWFWSN